MSHWQALLLHGYIHELEKEIVKSRAVIIPMGVVKLCYDFYKIIPNIILLLRARTRKKCRSKSGLYIADISNQLYFGCKIYELNSKNKSGKKGKGPKSKGKKKKSQKRSSRDDHIPICNNYGYYVSSVCYVESFAVSQEMNNKIQHRYNLLSDSYHNPFNTPSNEYNIIFKHSENICNAFIFDQNQFNKPQSQS